MNRWLILAAILAFVLAQRIILKFLVAKYASMQQKTYQYFENDNVAVDDLHQKTLQMWRNMGKSRYFTGGCNDTLESVPSFDSNEGSTEEKTEFPESFEDIFSGLNNQEINEILDEVLDEEPTEQ